MRILVGFIWDGKSGGIDAYLMAFARVARDEGVNLDFLTNEYCEELASELDGMGHRLYEIATLHDRPSQRKTIQLLCGQNAYDAAYFNISTALMYPVVKDAKDAGVPKVAVHSHAAGNDQNSWLRRIVFDVANTMLKPRMRRAADVKLACSHDAGRWLFGSVPVATGEVLVVPNPVDVDLFAFDEGVRALKRAELGASSKLVIGSVTGMKDVKNPFFLIDVFSKFIKLVPESMLVVVGGGELAYEVERYAANLLPAGSYQLLGKCENVHELLQAFDLFMLPSRKEGLSIAAIEAQVAGLPCMLSNGVPREAEVIPEIVCRASLLEDAGSWAKRLHALALECGISGTCGANSGNDAHGEKVAGPAREGCAERVAAAGYTSDGSRVVVELLKLKCSLPTRDIDECLPY